MRKLAIAMALASTGLATPAVARDHSCLCGARRRRDVGRRREFNITRRNGGPIREFRLNHKSATMSMQLPVTISATFAVEAEARLTSEAGLRCPEF